MKIVLLIPHPKHMDGSFENPKHTFLLMCKKIITVLHIFFLAYLDLCEE